ncbi:phosphosulfolactate synthase [Corynebacterium stationis]|uniref:phosphosulfolactate synthase n=1 Tax=Corynebacterium stationis TaxID=1705 RepID=UPI003012DBB7
MTEIRAPYYSTFGTCHLQDVFDVAGQWVDGIKWAGGSFALVPTEQVRALAISRMRTALMFLPAAGLKPCCATATTRWTTTSKKPRKSASMLLRFPPDLSC